MIDAAAVDFLELASGQWTANGGREDLAALVDEAFAALRPNSPGGRARSHRLGT